MGTMEAHVAMMDKQLKLWAVKLDKLVADAEKAGAEVKVDYRKGIDELKAKHKVVQAKLDELKAAGSAEWETFKAGVESAWNEFEVAFKKLAK